MTDILNSTTIQGPALKIEISVDSDDFQSDILSSVLGSYTNKAKNERGVANIPRASVERGEYKYIELVNDPRTVIRDLEKMGYSRKASRAEAKRQLQQDVDRIEAFGRGDWWYMFINCTLYAGGIKIAFDSICGVESDADGDYLQDLKQQVFDGCMDDLTATLKRGLGWEVAHTYQTGGLVRPAQSDGESV